MHTGKYNDISFGFFCLLCKSETIANKICNILYIGFLVIVGKYDGIFFFFKSFNFCEEVQVNINLNIQKPFIYCRPGPLNVNIVHSIYN